MHYASRGSYIPDTLHAQLRSGYGSVPGIFQLSFPLARPSGQPRGCCPSSSPSNTIAWRKRVAGQWPCLAGHEAHHDGPICDGDEIAWRPLWSCCYGRKIFSPLNAFHQRQNAKRRYLYQSVYIDACSLRVHWSKLKLDSCPLAANRVMEPGHGQQPNTMAARRLSPIYSARPGENVPTPGLCLRLIGL